jgi:hypothetical protein
MTEEQHSLGAEGPKARTRARRIVPPLILILLGLCLYLPGLGWGLPNTDSWSQDTIAGMRTLGVIASWPEDWQGRYEPLHYFINYAAYLPTLSKWEQTGEQFTEPSTGRKVFKPPYPEKIGLLIKRSRWISVVMACAAGIGLWAASRTITNDEWASAIPAGTLMMGASFTYFAHLGNVDVPAMCWFTWAVLFYARVIKHRKLVDCILLGLFAALSACTKLGVVGVLPGMVIVLLLNEVQVERKGESLGPALLRATLQWKWLLGIAAFALPFLLVSGVFYDFEAFVTRLRYWLDPTLNTTHAQQYRYPNQFLLAWAAIRYAASAVSWPMVVAMAAATVYTVRKYQSVALVLLLPALSYYVVVIATIHFVYGRFLFPILALLGILVGLSCVELWRNRQLPVTIRYFIPFVVGLPAIGYAIAVDAEMLTDSRYEVEAWFEKHVEPPSSVGVFSKPQYLPRVNHMGYSVHVLQMTRETFAGPLPEYLILSSYNYEDLDEQAQAVMEDLIGERLNYRIVATFRRRFLGTNGSWLSLAGWGGERVGKISPTVIVLQRKTE